MKNKKGVTLLELILAIALIGIIVTIGTNIFMIGNTTQKASVSEAEMQANTRLVSEHLNNIVRFATKTHTIPRSSFQYSNDGVRDPQTSYIGITKEGHVVIDEPPSVSGQPRKVKYLAKKKAGIDYEIVFNKALDSHGNEMDKILSFSIVGKKDGVIVNEIVSKVEVLNSINIEHLGTPSDPAVAIAYNMDDPGSQEWIEMSPDAYITLVLDKSGSMAWDMDGIKESENQKRIAILKEKALKMIDKLSLLDFNIYVSVVPFNDNANNPDDFKNLQVAEELEYVKNTINNLTANGGTNTGDGVRRAYNRLKNKADDLKSSGEINDYSDITQHMMILVDGQTNLETKKITSRNWLGKVTASEYTTDDVNVSGTINRLWGNYYGGSVGSHYSFDINNNDNAYITYLGNQKIKTYTIEFEGVQKQAINTFVIGFSNDAADHASLEAIGNAVAGKQFEHTDHSMKPYILATNADELDFAFEQFEYEVENSLWIITRPQLLP